MGVLDGVGDEVLQDPLEQARVAAHDRRARHHLEPRGPWRRRGRGTRWRSAGTARRAANSTISALMAPVSSWLRSSRASSVLRITSTDRPSSWTVRSASGSATRRARTARWRSSAWSGWRRSWLAAARNRDLAAFARSAASLAARSCASAALLAVTSRLVSSTSGGCPPGRRTSSWRLSTTTRRPSRVVWTSSPIHRPSRSSRTSSGSSGTTRTVASRSWLRRPIASAAE